MEIEAKLEIPCSQGSKLRSSGGENVNTQYPWAGYAAYIE
jgi:hypothetical protein